MLIFFKRSPIHGLIVFLLLVFFGFCTRGEQPKVHSLAGEWEIVRGKNWEHNQSWQKINLPNNISGNEDFKDYKGWVTIRKEIPLALMDKDDPLLLDTGLLCDVFEVYVNGHLIGSKGKERPYQSAMYRRWVGPIPETALSNESRSERNYIIIAIYTNGIYGIDVEGPDIRIGSYDRLVSDLWTSEVLRFLLIGIYLAVGFYHFLLAYKRPKDIYYLFFGLFCLSFSLVGFFNTYAREWVFADHVLFRMKMQHIITYSLPLWLFCFLRFLYEGKGSRFLSIFAIFTVILSLTSAIGSYSIMLKCLLVWEVAAVLLALFFIISTCKRVIGGNRDARYLLGGIVIVMFAAINDVLSDIYSIPSIKLSEYAFLTVILGIAGVLGNRFMGLHKEVEMLNSSLEDKVDERTSELQKTVQEMQKLREQQDADYFLTALLVQPLAGILKEQQNVILQSFVRQKKQFVFRKKQAEIGGDLVSAHRIELRNKAYTVFINGDAMGKSIQGAGGALVLGTVFKAHVTRTQLSPQAKDRSPEQWLKEAIKELQSIFVSFDGSMLVSCILGLVDETTGMLYFANAEHPFACLYSKGKATFIEEQAVMRKLGMPKVDGYFRVYTHLLKPTESVIIGSDGKDELLILDPDTNEDVVHSFEEDFLKRVEDAGGDLAEIFKAIERTGKIMDDISLLKIIYSGDGIELVELDEMMQELKLAFNGRDDEKVFNISSQIYERDPSNDEAMYFLARSALKLRKFHIASDLGESLRCRHPTSDGALLLLCETYRHLGNLDRSKAMLTKLLKLNPNHPQGLNIAEMLGLNPP